MTTQMENTIRPFAPVAFLPASSRLPSRLPEGIVQCKLGGSGGTTTSFSFEGSGFQFINNESYKESGRTSTNVRVENPEDPGQYVEFCRADKVSLLVNRGEQGVS